jgi:hypothetical protein
MLGRRSLSLPLIPCDPDIEHTLRQLRAERKASLSKENTTDTMAGVPLRLGLSHFFFYNKIFAKIHKVYQST